MIAIDKAGIQIIVAGRQIRRDKVGERVGFQNGIKRFNKAQRGVKGGVN
jgi:hypothetical protein